MIEYFTRLRDDILQHAKFTCFEELTVLHLLSFMGKKGYKNGIGAMLAEARMAASEKGYENWIGVMSAEVRMAASEKGYENGIGVMSAKARTAAGEKGYENGIGVMSAEARTAAGQKGSSNNKMGIAWEEKYAEFESYDGMPERGTPLHNWQQTQISNGHSSLNAKIRKEIEENKGSTVWSDRREKLCDCVEQKNRTNIGIARKEKYDEFESYDGMMERGTPLHNWQQNQLSNGAGSLNAKIQEELAKNKGSTVWNEWRVKRSDCVEQKRCE
jgi:hypothetical protein